MASDISQCNRSSNETPLELQEPDVKVTYPSFYRSFLSATLLGMLWGAWAFISNRSHGSEAAMKAAMTQIPFSFVSTFTFTVLVDYIYVKCQTFSKQIIFSCLAPTITLIGLLSAVHFYRGTPNILITIAPPSIMATMYCVSKFIKSRRKK